MFKSMDEPNIHLLSVPAPDDRFSASRKQFDELLQSKFHDAGSDEWRYFSQSQNNLAEPLRMVEDQLLGIFAASCFSPERAEASFIERKSTQWVDSPSGQHWAYSYRPQLGNHESERHCRTELTGILALARFDPQSAREQFALLERTHRTNEHQHLFGYALNICKAEDQLIGVIAQSYWDPGAGRAEYVRLKSLFQDSGDGTWNSTFNTKPGERRMLRTSDQLLGVIAASIYAPCDARPALEAVKARGFYDRKSGFWNEGVEPNGKRVVSSGSREQLLGVIAEYMIESAEGVGLAQAPALPACPARRAGV